MSLHPLVPRQWFAAAVTMLLWTPNARAGESMEFQSNVRCYDYSRAAAANGAAADCQMCTAFYNTGGNTMADAMVNVSWTPGDDGSLVGCATDSAGLNAIAGASTSGVMADGPAGARVPLVVTYAVNVTFTEHCSGGAFVSAGGQQFELNGQGARSGTLTLGVAAGAPVQSDVGATVSCTGCTYYDDEDGRHFEYCTNSGQAVADPSFMVDPRWPSADLYTLKSRDDAGNWVPVVPPDLDHDADGYEQPDDCNDYDASINPGQAELDDNDIDEDCNGGDGHAIGAVGGDPCNGDVDCGSGTCVLGICCDSRCGGGATDDCQSCRESATGSPDGVCAPVAAGVVCRAADDLCDLAEICDGTQKTCDGDFRKWVGDVCRPAVPGECDVAETCEGSGDPTTAFTTLCPADAPHSNENNGTPCATGLSGACALGTLSCGTCVPAAMAPETCNGVDDDCNGWVDDGFPGLGTFCFSGIGGCAAGGWVVCDADGTGTHCSGVELPAERERCDGGDNDCDGTVDEDFPEKGSVCTAGVGACLTTGFYRCSPFDAYATLCNAYPNPPVAETCNGIDDDCDGVIDDGAACIPTAVADEYATAMETPLQVPAGSGLLANDELAWTAVAVLDQGPAGGILDLADDGSFTYRPSACTQGADTFTYHLSDPVAGVDGPPATVTIQVASRPAEFAFETQTLSLAEGESGTALVRRTGDCSRAQQVTCYTQANTAAAVGDFTTVSSVLAFPPGVSIQPCTVTTISDAAVEGTESFYLRLKSQSAGTTLGRQRVVVATVGDDDDSGTIELGALTTELGEGGAQVDLTVLRHGGTAGTSASVKWATVAGSAGVADYGVLADETKVVTFGPDETTKTITVLVHEDTIVEGTESFRVALSAPSVGSRLGDVRSGVVAIHDNDDAGSIEFARVATEVGEAAGQVQIELVRSGATAGTTASVRWALASGSAGVADYAALADDTKVVTFGQNETAKTLTVLVTDDTLVEGTESFRLALSVPSVGARLGALRNADVHVRDDDALPAFAFEAAVEVVGESADTMVVRVVRSSALAAGSVTLRASASIATSPADFTATGQVVSFEAGQLEAIVAIPIARDALVEGDEPFNVVLSAPMLGTLAPAQRQVVVIQDDD